MDLPVDNVVPVLANAQTLNADGVRLSKQGNIELGLSTLVQAVHISPNDGEILGNLA